MVETPGKKATPTETVIPQTLGGMLPMVVGVDEQGQFDFDQAVLRAEVKGVLDGLAGQDCRMPSTTVWTSSVTAIASAATNTICSCRSAAPGVARYLIQKGVPASKVLVEGRGMPARSR